MRVPEKSHSIPCEHCGGDHKSESCMWRKDECPYCGEQLWYDRDGVGYCREHGCVTEYRL